MDTKPRTDLIELTGMKMVEPFAKNAWVKTSDRKPPFDTLVLFQTVDNLVFYGFRHSNTFNGVAVINSGIHTVEAEVDAVVCWFLPEDPSPHVKAPDVDSN